MTKLITTLIALSLLLTATPSGKIQPRVLDFASGQPIENAVVCVVEEEIYAKTDANGYTTPITVSVVPKKAYEFSPKKTGEVTLLVYKEGYADYVLLSTKVYTGVTRFAPTILLFKEDNAPPQVYCEQPTDEFISALIKKYKR